MALDKYSHEGKEVLADGGGGMGTVQGGQRPISKRPALEQGAEHANAIANDHTASAGASAHPLLLPPWLLQSWSLGRNNPQEHLIVTPRPRLPK